MPDITRFMQWAAAESGGFIWQFIIWEGMVPFVSAWVATAFTKIFGWKATRGQAFGFFFLAWFAISLAIFVIRNGPSVRSEPPLTVEATGVNMGYSTDGKTSLFKYSLRIYNPGLPTVVHGWALKIIGADGAQFDAYPIDLREVPVVVLNGGGALKNSEDLIEQGAHNPIPSGGMIEGWAVFARDRLSDNYLLNCRFQISLLDVANRKSTGEIVTQAAPQASTSGSDSEPLSTPLNASPSSTPMESHP
jgi:hypothetical protein